ncbi:hypothetical protein ABW19_dt0205811 [Dactylella cylindrospora]|nr:hypothetical protein ABW19_dt0205811 [Dactylella cylindrospora]
MPYHSTTPEVLAARLIGRADSRNPATTCRGISVSTGKPCRRSIAAKAPKGSSLKTNNSSDSDEINPAEEFFCWQHKDQAADTVVLQRSDSQKARRLQGRSSLDTLVEVILGADGGNEINNGMDSTGSGGAGSGGGWVGPDQAEIIIRRDTPLNDDEVMVVRKKTVVRKDAQMLKDAKRREEGKKAVWDALHGQGSASNQGVGQQNGRPMGTANGGSTYNSAHGRPPPSRPERVRPSHGMGAIEEAPGDTFPANNDFKRPQPRPRPKQRPSLLAQLFCCITDEEYSRSARPHGQSQQYQNARPRPQPQKQEYASAPPMQFHRYDQRPPYPVYSTATSSGGASSGGGHIKFTNAPQPPHPQPTLTASQQPNRTRPPKPSANPVLLSDSDSSSDEYSDGEESVCIPNVKSITPPLPSHLSTRTRAMIAAELRKPISQKDMPGYIYIFLLKDNTGAPPQPAAATLAPPTSKRKYSYSKTDPGSAALFRAVDDEEDDENKTGNGEKKVLLKIGRAQNVQRRLHQWSQQCGYNLQLIRFYPYVPLTDSPESGSPGSGSRKPSTTGETSPPAPSPGQKVPYSHRVERLIHLELRDEYYNRPHTCEECGRVHKEWFAVPGSREGVGRVDEVVKRWCKWGEDVEGILNGSYISSGEKGQSEGKAQGTVKVKSWSIRMVNDTAEGTRLGERERERERENDQRATGRVRGVERIPRQQDDRRQGYENGQTQTQGQGQRQQKPSRPQPQPQQNTAKYRDNRNYSNGNEEYTRRSEERYSRNGEARRRGERDGWR